MKRLRKFELLLNDLDKKTEEDYFKYIGTGKPTADILIIGKEASISKQEKPNQYKSEVAKNFYDWKKIIENGDFDQKRIPYPESVEYQTPLYPYKGQLLKIDNGSNKGTSRTWFTYQKLYNRIYNKNDNHKIDFHEGIFITEVNANPSRKTASADTDTVEFRKQSILSSQFVKDFPIVILAGVGYFDTIKQRTEDINEVEKIFGVRFQEQKLADGKDHQPYWIHWNHDKTRLLINTYQLSMGIADKLLDEIAEEIKKSGLLNKSVSKSD